MTSNRRTTGHGPVVRSSRRLGRRWALAAAASLTVSSMFGGWAQGAIKGAHVESGSATIRNHGPNTIIRAGDRAIIRYDTFDVPAFGSVRFIQPSRNSVVLNRISGNAPSHIDGAFSANGIVYFVNPAGITFGRHSVVNVGRLYAVAGAISDSDFKMGVNRFTIGQGKVENQGYMRGDAIHLLGGQVANSGAIVADKGIVTMTAASGEVMIAEQGGTIMVKAANADGSPAQPAKSVGVENTGSVKAEGGMVKLMGAGDIYAFAVKNAGMVKARRIEVDGGKGTVSVGGTLDASGRGSGEKGGSVQITGDKVALQGAKIDASGDAGGGTVLVGGDAHGQGGVATASQTTLSKDSSISADAITSGDGGKVVVWSDVFTNFYGAISARGGANSGNGGWVEVSGKQSLNFAGTVDVTAAHGLSGSILLDPQDIIFQNAAGPDDAQVGDGAIDFADGGGATDFTIGVGAVAGLSGNVTLQAQRDILVPAGVTVAFTAASNSATDTVTLQAGRHIQVLGSITTGGGNLVLSANDASGPAVPGGALDIQGPINTNGGNLTLRTTVFTNLTGTLTAGAGTVTFGTSDPTKTISVGVAGPDLTILAADLGQIASAGKVVIGEQAVQSGAVTVKTITLPAALANSSFEVNSDAGGGSVMLDTTGGTDAIKTGGNGAVTVRAGSGGIGAVEATNSPEINTGGAITVVGGDIGSAANALDVIGSSTLNITHNAGGDVKIFEQDGTHKITTTNIVQMVATAGTIEIDYSAPVSKNLNVVSDGTKHTLSSTGALGGDISFTSLAGPVELNGISTAASAPATGVLSITSPGTVTVLAGKTASGASVSIAAAGDVTEGAGGLIQSTAGNITINNSAGKIGLNAGARLQLQVAGGNAVLTGSDDIFINSAVTLPVGPVSTPGAFDVASAAGLTFNGNITALSVNAQSGTSGTGNIGFGAGVTVNADTQSYRAGDGAGGVATAVVDLGSNTPAFADTATTGKPVTFQHRSDGAVTDAALASSFPHGAPTTYSIISDEASVTLSTAAKVAGSALSLNGSTGVNVGGGATISVASLNATGAATLNGSITATTGGITLNNNATLNTATVVLTSAGAMSLQGVAGANHALTLDGGATGVITVNGNVDAVTTLTLTNSNGATFAGTIGQVTPGNITVSNTQAGQTVAFQNDTRAVNFNTTANGYNVSLTGTTNSFTSVVSFQNTGTVTLGNGAGDATNFTGGVTRGAALSTHLFGTVTTTNQTMSLGAVTLDGDATVKSGSASLTLGSVTGAHALAVQDAASTGAVTISGNATIDTLTTFAGAYSVALQGTANAFTNLVTFNNTNGVTIGTSNVAVSTFNGGLTSTASATTTLRGTTQTSGDAILLGAVNLTGNVTINTTAGGNAAGADLTTGAITTSSNTNTLAIDSGTLGDISVGTIGAGTALGSVTATGHAISLSNVSTVGAQSYTGTIPMTLGGTLYQTDGGTFTINGIAVLPATLTIDTNSTGAANGGLVDLSAAILTASAAGVNLTIDTSSSSGGHSAGAVKLGDMTSAGGNNISALTVTSIGDSSVVGSNGLATLSGDIAITNDVTFNNGGVTQSAGTLTATGLLLQGKGTYAINQPGNHIVNLAAALDPVNNGGGLFSSVDVADVDDLTIPAGGVGGVIGIKTAAGGGQGGDVALSSGGTINVAAVIDTKGGAGGVLNVSAGGVILGAAINLGNGNVTLSGSGEDLIINVAQNVTSFTFTAPRDVIVNAPITGTGDLIFTADNDFNGTGGVQVNAGGSISTAGNITITGSELHLVPNVGADIQGTVTGGGAGTAISVNTDNVAHVIQLGTTVSSTGADITFSKPVVLAADTNVSSGGGIITFADTVRGAHALVANSGTGALHFQGIVGGGGSPLASLAASGNTIDALDVTTTGSQSYTATGGGTVTFNGTTYQTDGGTFSISGNAVITASTLIDTETGNDGPGGNVDLSAAGISATADDLDLTINTATTLATNAGGTVSLGGFNNAAGSNIRDLTIDTRGGGGAGGTDGLLTLGGTMTLAGSVAGTADATFTVGGIDQTAGGLTADTLLILGTANAQSPTFSMTRSNAVGKIAANIIGSLGFNNQAIAVAIDNLPTAVPTTNGITATGNVLLEGSGGITQAPGAIVTAAGLGAINSGSGLITLDLANNVGTFAGSNTAATLATDEAIHFNNAANALTIGQIPAIGAISTLTGVTTTNGNVLLRSGALTIHQGISTGSGIVRIVATTVTEDAATGIITTTGGLGIQANGNIDMFAVGGVPQNNDVAKVAINDALAGATVDFSNPHALSVDQIAADGVLFTAATGITTNAGDALLNAGVLTLNQPINVGTNTVRLMTAGGVSQTGVGLITAGTLGVRNTGSGNIDLTQNNLLAGPAATPGVFAAINSAAGGSVQFVNAGDVGVGSVAARSLFAAINAGSPNGTSNGTFAVTTGGNLTLDTDISTVGGAINLIAAGSITLNATASGGAGGGDVILAAGDAIAQNAGSLIGNNLTAATSHNAGADITLLGNNNMVGVSFALAAGNAAGTIQYHDGSDVDIVSITSNSVASPALTLTSSGSITQSGDVTVVGGVSLTATNNITFGSTGSNYGAVSATAGGDISLTTGGTLNVAAADSTGGGDITLTADAMTFTGGNDSIVGTGQLILQPLTASSDIVIGAVPGGQLEFADTAPFKAGFSLITVGRPDGTGTGDLIVAGNITFHDNVDLNAGRIYDLGAAVLTADKDLTLEAQTAGIGPGVAHFALVPDNIFDVNVGGHLNVITTGPIALANAAGDMFVRSTQDLVVGPITTDPATTQTIHLETTGSHSITVANSSNTNDNITLITNKAAAVFDAPVVVNNGVTLTGNTITVTADGSITSAGTGKLATIAGDLVLTSNGSTGPASIGTDAANPFNVSVAGGNLVVTTAATGAAGDIFIASSSNLSLGQIATHSAGLPATDSQQVNIATTGAAGITIAAASDTDNTGLLKGDDQWTLTSAAGITGSPRITGSSITLQAASGIGVPSALTLRSASVSATVTGNGNIVINNESLDATVPDTTAALTTPSGDTTFNRTGGGTLSLNGITATSGNIAVDNATGDIALAGATSASGTVGITADAGAINGNSLISGSSITLAGAAGVGNVTQIQTATHTLSATATNGSVDVHNAIAGAVSFTGSAAGAGHDLNLLQSGGGTLTVNASAARNATVTNSGGDILIDSITAGATANINASLASGASINELANDDGGAIHVDISAQDLNLVATGSIGNASILDLHVPGTITFTAGAAPLVAGDPPAIQGDVRISNDTSFSVGASTIWGDLLLEATAGDITGTGLITVDHNATFQVDQAGHKVAINGGLTLIGHTDPANDGSIIITADDIDLGGANSIIGHKDITLEPTTITRGISIGTVGVPNVLELSPADIAALAEGYSSITIGRADGQHAISIASGSFKDALTIQTPSGGSIALTGQLDTLGNTQALVAAPITLTGPSIAGTASTQFQGSILTSGAPITINDNVQLTGGASTRLDTSSAVPIAGGSDITINGFFIGATGGESLVFNAGANGNILVTGNVGSATDAVGSGTSALGSLTVELASNVTFSRGLTTVNNATLQAAEIDLPGAGGTKARSLGGGVLTLLPFDATRDINVGTAAGADPNSLDLSTTDLATLGGGWSKIVVGFAGTGSGTTSIGDATFPETLEIQQPLGSIHLGGNLSTGNTASNGSVTFFGPVDVTANASVNTNHAATDGFITFKDTVTGAGNLTLDSGAAGSLGVVGNLLDVGTTIPGTIFEKDINNLGSLPGPALTILSTGPTEFAGLVTTNAGISATQDTGTLWFTHNVTINAGDSVMAGNVIFDAPGLAFQSAGAVTFGSSETTNFGAFTGNRLQLNGPSSITLANKDLVVNAWVDGGVGNPTLGLDTGSGNATFHGPVGMIQPPGTLTIASSGTTTFQRNVHVAGNLLATSDTGTVAFDSNPLAAHLALDDVLVDGNASFAGSVSLNNQRTAGSHPELIFHTGGTASFGNNAAQDHVTLAGGTIKVVTNSQTLDFNSDVNGGVNLVVDSGTANTSFNGPVGQTTALGSGTGAAITIATGDPAGVNGTTTFASTVNANSGILATAGGSRVVFFGDVTLAKGDTDTLLSGEVVLRGLTFASRGAVTFSSSSAVNRTITLADGPVTVDTHLGTGSITFDGQTTGAQNLTLNSGGNISMVLNVHDIGDIDATSVGSTSFGASILNAGDLTIHAGTTIGVAGPVNTAGNITAVSGTSTSFNSITNTGDILANAGTTLTVASASTVGNITTTSGGNTTFGPITSAGNINMQSSAAISVGAINNVGTIQTQSTGTTTFTGVVQTSGNITATTTNSLLTFAGAISGVGNMVLDSGSANTLFQASLSNVGTGAGAAITINTSGETQFQSTLAANSGLNATADTGLVTFFNDVTLAAGNTGTTLNGSVKFDNHKAGPALLFTSAGTVALGNNATVDHVTLTGGPLSLTTSSKTVNFNALVDGAQNLSLDSGTATTTFAGAVGSATPLGTGTGAAITIATSGQTIFQSTLSANSGLNATADTGLVTFFNDVTLAAGNTGTTLNGSVTFDNHKAGTALLFASGGTVALGNNAAVDHVTLAGGPLNLSTASKTIDFGALVDGAQNLSVDSGSATTTFLGAVGSATPLGTGTGAAITIATSGQTIFQSTLSANSGLNATADTGLVTFFNDVTLAAGNTGTTLNGSVTFDNHKGGGAALLFASGGTVILGDTATVDQVTLAGGPLSLTTANQTVDVRAMVDGGQNLVLDSGSAATTFFGTVGAASSIGTGTGAAITINSSGETRFQKTVAANSGLNATADTGLVTFWNDVTLAAGDTGTTLAGSVKFDNHKVALPLTFSSAGTLALGNNPAADQVTLTGGSLSITTSNKTLSVNALVDGAQNLSIDTGSAAATFAGAIGSNTAIGSGTGAAITIATSAETQFQSTLAANSGLSATADTGLVTFFNDVTLAAGDTGTTLAGSVTFDNHKGAGALIFNAGGTVALGNSATLDHVTLTGGNLALRTTNGNAGKALDIKAMVDGGENLTLDSGSAKTTFFGKVGSTTAIGTGTGAAITIATSGETQFQNTVNAASGINATANNGLLTFWNDVSLAAGNLGSTFSGSVKFDNHKAAGAALAFNSHGTLTLGNSAVADHVTLAGGPLDLTTVNKAIAVNAQVDGAQNLTLDAGTADTTFSGAVGSATPIGTGTGAAITINSRNGTETQFGGTLSTRSGITASADRGLVTFMDNVALAAGNTPTTLNGSVKFDPAKATQTFHSAGAVTFGNSAASQSDPAVDKFTATKGSITVTADQKSTFAALVANAANLSVTANGVEFDHSISGNGSLTLQSTGTGANIVDFVQDSVPFSVTQRAITLAGRTDPANAATVAVIGKSVAAPQLITGDFTITGDLTMGVNQRLTVLGNLKIEGGSTHIVTLADTSVFGTLSLNNVSELKVLTRGTQTILDNAGGQVTSESVSIVGTQGVQLNGARITLVDANGATAAAATARFASNGGPTTLLNIAAPSTLVQLNPQIIDLGQVLLGSQVLSLDARGTDTVQIRVTAPHEIPSAAVNEALTSGLVARLEDLGIYTRDVGLQQLIAFLQGITFYNDVPGEKLAPTPSPTTNLPPQYFRVTDKRLSRDAVLQVINDFLDIFDPVVIEDGKKKVDAKGEFVREDRRQAIRASLEAAVSAYKKANPGPMDPLAFRAWLEKSPEHAEALAYMNKVRALFEEILPSDPNSTRGLGVTPLEATLSRTAIIRNVLKVRGITVADMESAILGVKVAPPADNAGAK